jgi:hypothetical protein
MSKNEQKRVNQIKKRAKLANIFTCKICDYNTSRHSNYLRHIETKKHLEKHKKVLYSVKSVIKPEMFVPNSFDKNKSQGKDKSKFYCNICDYNASQKSHYEKHLKTKKHTNNLNFFSGHLNNINNNSFATIEKSKPTDQIDDKPNELDRIREQLFSIIEKQKLIEKDTDDMKMKNKQGQIIYNNNISINFFLDTYCSNAQPIQDFISNMSFKLGDIMRNNQLVENFISKKLLKGLEDMPLTERPIHCTDQKRKNFIVKDEREGWVKEVAIDNTSKLYTRVDQLHKKAYIDFYNEYDKENPLPHDGEKEQIKFNISSQIIKQNDDVNKVIIRDIAKQVDICDVLGDVNNTMLENTDSNSNDNPLKIGNGSSSENEGFEYKTEQVNSSELPNVSQNNINNTNIKFSINITDN